MDVDLYLADLPLWASGLLLVGGATLVAVIGPPLVRRHVGLERLRLNNEVAGFGFATLGVIYAVLLGFSVIVVWEKLRDAEDVVTRETGAIASLYRLSGGLDPDVQAKFHAALTRYLGTVIADDWPAMARGEHGEQSRAASHASTEVYGAALAHAPSGPRDAVVLAAIFDQLDQVTQARRQRLDLASGAIRTWL